MLPRNYLLNGIADALKEAHEAFNEEGKEVHEALDRATREICNVLKRNNPNVDRERFMRAAGYGTGQRMCRECMLDCHEDCTTCDCAKVRHGLYNPITGVNA